MKLFELMLRMLRSESVTSSLGSDMVSHGNAKKRIKGAGFGGSIDYGNWPYPP